MGEYISTDRQLLDELCKARLSDMEAEFRLIENRFKNSVDPCARAPYRYYREYISMPSLPLVPGTAMLSPQEWLNMPLSKCFDDFQHSEKKYQDMIMRSVSCRLMAAVKLINGITVLLWHETPARKPAHKERWAHLATVVEVSPDDILENPLTHESDDVPESYYFFSKQRELPLHKLIIKALILQELQRRLIDVAKQTAAPAGDQEPAAPAGNQEVKKDSPIIEAVKSWEPGKNRPKIFFTEIDKIKKRLEVGTDQAINSFCGKYGFSGQEKAFKKSYECHCKALAQAEIVLKIKIEDKILKDLMQVKNVENKNTPEKEMENS
jgi:hypothetical protein